MFPEYLGKKRLIDLGYPEKKLIEYPGIKEYIYIPFFKEDLSLYSRINLNINKIIILYRPPSSISHYNSGIDYDVSYKLVRYLIANNDIQLILLFRYTQQIKEYSFVFGNCNVIIPKQVEDGLNLISISDIVISGGGTMNREAAAMNVPVYSIFQGKKAAIDSKLEAEGKLVFINSQRDFSLIRLEKKTYDNNFIKSFDTINFILSVIKNKCNEII